MTDTSQSEYVTKPTSTLEVPIKSTEEDTHGTHNTGSRQVLVFSDFDGTIFRQDTGHILFDLHGCGPERRKELEMEIVNGIRGFREVSEDMWDSLKLSFEDGFAAMQKHLEIDPGFADFQYFCKEKDIPFTVISAGLKPLLRAVLDHFLGKEMSQRISIVSNDGTISEAGKWTPLWRHDTPLGHDKARSITELRESMSGHEPPLIIFIGDGISDLPAAQEADVLFARRGLRLEDFCVEHKIPYIPFDTFFEIKEEIQTIIGEDIKAKDQQGKPKYVNTKDLHKGFFKLRTYVEGV